MALTLLASDVYAAHIYNQRAYRWRNDDGTLDTATWKAAQNTPVGIAKNQNIRLRFEINNMSAMFDLNETYQIQYAADAGHWTTIPASGTAEAFVMNDTAHYGNNAQTLTAYITGGIGIFQPGYALDTSNESPNFTVSPSGRTEFEYCFQTIDTTLAGQTYYFRLWHGPTSVSAPNEELDSYTE